MNKKLETKQKTREFKKKIPLKNKEIEKRLGKRMKPNKLNSKAKNNLYRIQSTKYDFTSDQVEEKSLENDEFSDLYDFNRLVRVKGAKERIERSEKNKDGQARGKLRDALDIGEKGLVLAERLKQNDAPGNLYKSKTENKPLF